jgi:small subunit ribosomal protein S17
MDKTVVVAVDWSQPHPLYRKKVKKVTKFHAHDAENKASVGDVVRLVETRPLSKTKRWRVAEILKAADTLGPDTSVGLVDGEQTEGEASGEGTA